MGTTTAGLRNPYGNQNGMSAGEADEMTKCDLMIIVDRYTQHIEQEDMILETISGARCVTKELLETTNSRASVFRVLGMSIDTIRRAANADPLTSRGRRTTYIRLIQRINEVCSPPEDPHDDHNDDDWWTPESTWSVEEFTRSPSVDPTDRGADDITQQHDHGAGIGGFRNPYGNGQGKDGKGKGKGKGNKNKSPENIRIEGISWGLSKILRHTADEWGLAMGDDGYVAVREVIRVKSLQSYRPTLEDIEGLVSTSRKERFQIVTRNNTRMTRDIQGHTIRRIDDRQISELIPPHQIQACVHRTNIEAWSAIRAKGLVPMGRNHAHFILAGETRLEVPGARLHADVEIVIDVKKAHGDGIEFRRATNGAILTRGLNGMVGTKYFTSATYCKDGFHREGKILWPRSKPPVDADAIRTQCFNEGRGNEWRHCGNKARLKIRLEEKIQRDKEREYYSCEEEGSSTHRKETPREHPTHAGETSAGARLDRWKNDQSSSSWERRNHEHRDDTSNGTHQWYHRQWQEPRKREEEEGWHGGSSHRRWKNADEAGKWTNFRNQWEQNRKETEQQATETKRTCVAWGQSLPEGAGDIVSAGITVVRQNDEKGEPEILLIGRGRRVSRPAVPKGRQENGETIIETAYRELKEEAGLDLTANTQAVRFGNTKYKFGSKNKTVHYFAHGTTDMKEEDYQWVERERQTKIVEWWTESEVDHYGAEWFGHDNARIMHNALRWVRTNVMRRRCREADEGEASKRRVQQSKVSTHKPRGTDADIGKRAHKVANESQADDDTERVERREVPSALGGEHTTRDNEETTDRGEGQDKQHKMKDHNSAEGNSVADIAGREACEANKHTSDEARQDKQTHGPGTLDTTQDTLEPVRTDTEETSVIHHNMAKTNTETKTDTSSHSSPEPGRQENGVTNIQTEHHAREIAADTLGKDDNKSQEADRGDNGKETDQEGTQDRTQHEACAQVAPLHSTSEAQEDGDSSEAKKKEETKARPGHTKTRDRRSVSDDDIRILHTSSSLEKDGYLEKIEARRRRSLPTGHKEELDIQNCSRIHGASHDMEAHRIELQGKQAVDRDDESAVQADGRTSAVKEMVHRTMKLIPGMTEAEAMRQLTEVAAGLAKETGSKGKKTQMENTTKTVTLEAMRKIAVESYRTCRTYHEERHDDDGEDRRQCSRTRRHRWTVHDSRRHATGSCHNWISEDTKQHERERPRTWKKG